jgi:hypothetical protein
MSYPVICKYSTPSIETRSILLPEGPPFTLIENNASPTKVLRDTESAIRGGVYYQYADLRITSQTHLPAQPTFSLSECGCPLFLLLSSSFPHNDVTVRGTHLA